MTSFILACKEGSLQISSSALGSSNDALKQSSQIMFSRKNDSRGMECHYSCPAVPILRESSESLETSSCMIGRPDYNPGISICKWISPTNDETHIPIALNP
jgi:hypothetical protein